MNRRRFSARNRRPTRPGWQRSRRFRGARRGIADVVATILILALTVTLFASIFAFVTAFPAPPAQNTSQFSATLLRTANQTYISGLAITHLSGPLIQTSDRIFLQTSNAIADWQFSAPTGIPVGWGLTPPNSSSGWNLGQVWTTSFNHLIKVPDNITIAITSPSQLLYTVVLPGLSIATPPAITSAGITPTNPAIGAAFQIYATIIGNLSGATVTVALGGVPGLSGTPAMSQSGGLWVYNVSAGETTTGGSYYVFINATNGAGQSATTAVGVTIPGGSGGGGGGGGGGVSVAVGLSLQPPILPKNATYFWAAVTYPGALSGVTLNVTFWVNETPGGFNGPTSYKFYAPAATISGPGTVTVYSTPQPTFPGASQAWFLNSTVSLQALATLTQGGFTAHAVGTTTFKTANLIVGMIYTTSSSTGALPVLSSWSHSCSGSGPGACPYLYVMIWDNYTVADGSTSTITVNGSVAKVSGPHAYSYTIGSTSITPGTPLAIDPVGATTRIPTPTGASAGNTEVLSVTLTFTEGSAIVGYVYDQFKITFT
jgi:Archaeal Type IV pilin, N-terminal